jgi:hypothetical protein
MARENLAQMRRPLADASRVTNCLLEWVSGMIMDWKKIAK